MRTTSLLITVVGLVVVLSMLCIYFLPSTQDFMTANDKWNGVSRFYDEFGAVTVDSLDDLPESPVGAVLLLIPYIELEEAELAAVARFIEGGGNLLLMDDYSFGNSVLSYLEVDARFTGEPLLDPLFNLKNLRLPRIANFAPEVTEAGIDAILMNHATTLMDVIETEAIAWSSISSFQDTDESETWEETEPKGPFPMAARFPVGDGDVVVVADPSVLTNSIIGQNDNYAFIRYLVSRNGQQQSILFATSHLPKDPLDVSKSRLDTLQPILASPAGLLGITALLFITISRYALKKGGTIEGY